MIKVDSRTFLYKETFFADKNIKIVEVTVSTKKEWVTTSSPFYIQQNDVPNILKAVKALQLKISEFNTTLLPLFRTTFLPSFNSETDFNRFIIERIRSEKNMVQLMMLPHQYEEMSFNQIFSFCEWFINSDPQYKGKLDFQQVDEFFNALIKSLESVSIS